MDFTSLPLYSVFSHYAFVANGRHISINGSFVHIFQCCTRYLFASGHGLPVVGIIQILINKYQQRQLYKLVAMGKATLMDVPGEAEGWIKDTAWSPSAVFLLPFLLFVQVSNRACCIWLTPFFRVFSYIWHLHFLRTYSNTIRLTMT